MSLCAALGCCGLLASRLWFHFALGGRYALSGFLAYGCVVLSLRAWAGCHRPSFVSSLVFVCWLALAAWSLCCRLSPAVGCAALASSLLALVAAALALVARARGVVSVAAGAHRHRCCDVLTAAWHSARGLATRRAPRVSRCAWSCHAPTARDKRIGAVRVTRDVTWTRLFGRGRFGG